MKKRLILRFPVNKVEEPVVYNLIKEFDVIVNILNADINPGREGKLLVEMKAPRKNMELAIDYMESINVDWSPVKKSIILNEDDCIHCGSCSAVCFAEALTLDRHSRELIFRPEKCIACELCITACPLKLFELDFHHV